MLRDRARTAGGGAPPDRDRAGPALRLALLVLLWSAADAAASPLGVWVTKDGQAHVAIDACENAPAALCGRIVWAEPPAAPEEAYDRRNPDAALRTRPIVGMPLMWGFVASAPGSWIGGKVYDPTTGFTWNATLSQADPDTLDVAGCILFLCLGETWRRIGPVTSGD